MFQMMKKIMKWTTTSKPEIAWKPGKRLKVGWMHHDFRSAWTYKTGTSRPKGKQGKLYSRYWLDFGQQKFEFKRFSVKGKPFNDGYSFIKALEKRGFKTLGSGAFSTVLGKDGSDRVIKVIRQADNWIDYIQWAAKKGEAGKFAPKVYSYKQIKGKKKDFSVAIMERLEYTFYKAPEDHALKILPELMYRANDNPMAASFSDILAPGLRKYLEELNKDFNSHDFHPGNLMIRKDGSFVISDPVAGKQTSDYKRLKAGDFSPALTLKLLAA